MLTFRAYFRIKNETIAVIIMEIIERTQIRLQTERQTNGQTERQFETNNPTTTPLHKQLRCV